MLELVIVFSIYAGLQRIIDIPFIARIRHSTNVEDAIIHRKRLKTVRFVFLVLYVALYVAFSIVDFLSEETGGFGKLLKIVMFVVVLLVYLKKSNQYSDFFIGNISTMKKEDYLKQVKRYAIFLRGFGEDDYSKEEELFNMKYLNKFSEFWFVYVLKQRISVCAIGMTKEIDSPIGAQRIFLDDKNWKEEVRDLMEKSEEIYILVNDRESCIWEIEQSMDLVGKTMYIIDDRSKYESVRTQIEDRFSLPPILDYFEQEAHVMLRIENGQPLFECYDNNVVSYAQKLNVFLSEDTIKAAQKIRKYRRIHWPLKYYEWLWIILIIVLLVLIALTDAGMILF